MATPETNITEGRPPGTVWIALAALHGAISVMAGAFAAHALDPVADAKRIGWLHTGSLYEALHGLAMLAVCSLLIMGRDGRGPLNRRLGQTALWLFCVGALLFPGALYGLAAEGPRWLGAVVPFGGTALIAGWAVLAWAALRGCKL